MTDKGITVDDLLKKFGSNPRCYLTGKDIDINKPSTYQFDHIVPVSKGGESTFENLGVTTPEANYAKGNLSVEEFIELCKDVLHNFGYKVIK